MRSVATFLLAAALAAPAVLAQSNDVAAAPRVSEIRITLPAGTARRVAVEPEGRIVVVELPRGAALPMDFADASGGLVRSAEVAPTADQDDRLRVVLQLAAGYLARFEIDEDALTLKFQTRLGAGRASADPEGRYVLGPDDKIALTVHNHPELTATLTVSREGTVTVPLVGVVEADGRSPAEIELQVAEMLGRSYFVDPQVDISVAEYRSQWVMVTGAVPVTGRIFLRGGTRLKEVLSEAGGFRETSGEKITISRRREGTEQFEVVNIDRRDFEAGTANPAVRHGDIIDVSKAQFCYIQGEVRNPSRVPIERGTTLLQAITIVGGLTEWADRRTVTILSAEGGSEARKVNLKRIQANKEPDPVLQGGDIVVVGRRFF